MTINKRYMKNILKIYLVKHAEAESIDEVYAYFDTKEKATDFLNRFKTIPQEMEIIEIPLNPKYIANKEVDPYFVSLKGKTETDPFDLIICDYIEQAESAQKEEYSIDFLRNDSIDNGNFKITLFAANEDEATVKAIKIRDEVIASGEWDKAFSKKGK